MRDLADFLNMPDVSDIVEEIYIDEKIGTIKVRAMSITDRDQYFRRSQQLNKKNKDIDMTKYNLLILENHIVEPDFRNAEFLKKVKCSTVAEFYSKKFDLGQIDKITSAIARISGLDYNGNELEEAVAESKN